MLRKLALILLPIALLAAACGGGSSNDGAVRDSDDEPKAASRAAGPDGIYGTGDDVGVGDVQSPEPSDDSMVAFDPGDEIDVDDGTAGANVTDAGDDFVVIDGSEADDGFDSLAVNEGGLDDNVVFGALNPFAFMGGSMPPASQAIDSDLGSALLTDSDIPSGFVPMGEFSFSMPSEFGDMDMAARMWGRGVESDEFGAMIMSAAIVLPPEAMGELDELMGLTEADLAEIQGASDDFGMDFAKFEMLDADGLGEGGFGMHMEIDFGAFFSAFGAPEDDEMPAGIAMDMYAFAVGDRVLMVMVMWPIGEPPGADGRSLAEIMASRA
ncbi:MAG: hypothetical protein J4N95_02850 [Chloroflexi bacterium]|nr:hypothetical protein [Chloroflexota bacterium]MCI0855749.1 hypothetical protein [Chloroflexota bacterium]MCI0889384.1 hypothetical protein [Chloroflexota bacterium]